MLYVVVAAVAPELMWPVIGVVSLALALPALWRGTR